MACTRPREVWFVNGKVRFTLPAKDEGFSRTGQLPCGSCIGCRLDHGRQWATRIVHESQMHAESCTVLLTYATENLPPFNSLRYTDVQDFLKALRHKLHPLKIRFYACGEYGEKTKRPHYHLVLFGWCPKDPKPLSEGRSGNPIFGSEFLQSCWPHGFATWQRFEPEAAEYVARYVTKKITGPAAPEAYQSIDKQTGEIGERVAEFARMSRRPGLGAKWFDRYYQSDVAHRDAVLNHNNRPTKVPRYYDKLVAKLYGDPALSKIKRKRVLNAEKRKDADPRSVAYAQSATEINQKARLGLQKRGDF